MKQIKIRPGVVLISVCDEHILVATREAREHVPYVRQINGPAGFYWNLLEEGLAVPDIIRQAAEKYDLPGRKAAAVVVNFMQKLQKAGYITVEDVEDAE